MLEAPKSASKVEEATPHEAAEAGNGSNATFLNSMEAECSSTNCLVAAVLSAPKGPTKAAWPSKKDGAEVAEKMTLQRGLGEAPPAAARGAESTDSASLVFAMQSEVT